MIASMLLQQVPGTEDAPVQVPTPDIDWQGLLPVLILFVGGLLLLTITGVDQLSATLRRKLVGEQAFQSVQ